MYRYVVIVKDTLGRFTLDVTANNIREAIRNAHESMLSHPNGEIVMIAKVDV